jgi:hypothetical protein
MAVLNTDNFDILDVMNEFGLGGGDSLSDCIADSSSGDFNKYYNPNEDGLNNNLYNFRDYNAIHSINIENVTPTGGGLKVVLDSTTDPVKNFTLQGSTNNSIWSPQHQHTTGGSSITPVNVSTLEPIYYLRVVMNPSGVIGETYIWPNEQGMFEGTPNISAYPNRCILPTSVTFQTLYYHDGEDGLPATGDKVYTNVAKTTPLAAGQYQCNSPWGYGFDITGTLGLVTDDNICYTP